MGSLSWIFRVSYVSLYHMYPCKMEAGRNLTDRREGDVTMEAKAEVLAATRQAMPAASRCWERQGTKSPPRASRGGVALMPPSFVPLILISDFWPPEL